MHVSLSQIFRPRRSNQTAVAAPTPATVGAGDHLQARSPAPSPVTTQAPAALQAPVPQLRRPSLPDLPGPAPVNALVTPMLTDFYQVNMAYALYKAQAHEARETFELYFRKNPFDGAFTVFAGLHEVLGILNTFRFSADDIAYLRGVMPEAADDAPFFAWLAQLDCKDVTVHALREGTVAFPNVPLLRIEGPAAVCRLLETTLLNAVNFPSLMATNAVHHRLIVGPDKGLVEGGLRRAQGPDGGISASRYSYLGGFDGTSNVAAAKLFNIPVRGTHAHSFVTHFGKQDVNRPLYCKHVQGHTVNLTDVVNSERARLTAVDATFANTKRDELAAFTAYAAAFPKSFVALVDTYDTLASGVPNFIVVASALRNLGYQARGIRLDSGDLAHLSKAARALFERVAPYVRFDTQALRIVASNDLNPKTLASLKQQNAAIDDFLVGTNLVTCQQQPALGCVYKLVDSRGEPRIKLSEDVKKTTIPGAKMAYRLFNREDKPLLDLMLPVDAANNARPVAGRDIRVRHPFEYQKHLLATPSRVEALHVPVWKHGAVVQENMTTLEQDRAYCAAQVASMREDHLRTLNPTPYKVSLSEDLFTITQEMIFKHAPEKHVR